MAHRFIVGETPRAALRSLRHLWEHGAAVSLDLLGEATVTQPEADRYAERCLDALETLAGATPRWPERPVLEHDSLGVVPRVNVSVKVSALSPLLRPEAPDVGRDDAARRMRPLLLRAKELGAHLHIDMESVDTLEATMQLVFDLLDEPELRDGPSAGVVLQAYLRESPEQLEQVIEWARSAGRRPPLVVRLVKGAYWDHEVVEARQHGWTPPVFEDKAESDRNFEQLTRRLLEGWPHVRPAIASHNLRSVAHAVAASRAAGRDDRDLELQVLRGLGDDLAAALADQGMRVRIYCPVGDMVAGMAYLVRRLLENTANESFLSDLQRGVPGRAAAGRAVSFRNEPILELRRAPAREALLEALRGLDAKLPLSVPVLVGGGRGSDEGLDSTDPGRPDRLVAHAGAGHRGRRRRGRGGGRSAAFATGAPARRPSGPRRCGRPRPACASAATSSPRSRCANARSPGPQADADVCEAIDFLEYYADGALELERGRDLIQVPGERNEMRYAPRGVTAVIAPWNFPLAIPCGMTAAALAAGNAAILKPAEQSPASAGALVEALHEGGVPRDALSLLPGFGEVGAALVRDPRVHMIAFTGSGAVGLDILRAAAETPEGQGFVKRVVAEMGGKNCVIVDADADLDEAVPAIVESAFGYAGQKCSAAARVLVHEAIADTLVERVAGATEVLRVGQAEEFATEVPPVIEREAQERVQRYARAGRARGPAGRPRRGGARGRLVLRAGDRRRPARGVAGQPRGDLRPAAVDHDRAQRRAGLRRRRLAPVRAHRRAVLAQPRDRGPRGRPGAGRQPLRQPRHHRGDGGTPAVRRQPSLGDRRQGGRARLPVAIHRAACSYREHDATGNTRRIDGKEAGHDRSSHPRHPRRLHREGPHAGQGPRRVLRDDPAGPGRVAGRVLRLHRAARHRRRRRFSTSAA